MTVTLRHRNELQRLQNDEIRKILVIRGHTVQMRLYEVRTDPSGTVTPTISVESNAVFMNVGETQAEEWQAYWQYAIDGARYLSYWDPGAGTDYAHRHINPWEWGLTILPKLPITDDKFTIPEYRVNGGFNVDLFSRARLIVTAWGVPYFMAAVNGKRVTIAGSRKWQHRLMALFYPRWRLRKRLSKMAAERVAKILEEL